MSQYQSFNKHIQNELSRLAETGNLRSLPHIQHEGNYVVADGKHQLNLSSNDYLGLAANPALAKEFLETAPLNTSSFTASSSRLFRHRKRVGF